MALEGIGFALGLISELRTQINNVLTRIDNFRQAPAKLQKLSGKLDNMTAHVTDIEGIVRSHPETIPLQTSDMFLSRLESVQICLQSADSIMDQLLTDEFETCAAGRNRRLFQILRRLSRADDIATKISSVASDVKEASSVLQVLVCELSLCAKMETVGAKLNAADVATEYTPEGSTPALPHTISLNFDAQDEDGNLTTPEAKLKDAVLSNDSPDGVTAAAGAINPAYGVVGMAGVGKTVALQGLAYEGDIQARFVDGVHYMSFGRGATLETAIREIGKIMKATGATAIVREMESSSSITEVVNSAVKWFRGKTCLFLIDDLWPDPNCRTGVLAELQQLLRGSPDSRMAITTRSVPIALSAGNAVDFDARDPLGQVSQRIFMVYAGGSNPQSACLESVDELRASVSRILSLCGGLPIALSVAGRAVAFLTRMYRSFDFACDAYAIKLDRKRTSLGSEQNIEGICLSSGILLSLEYLQDEFLQWKQTHAPNIEDTISDLYIALCVFTNKAWVPVAVLSRLWGLSEDNAFDIAMMFSEMSLATLESRPHKHLPKVEPGLAIHGLHLEFCQRQAEKDNAWSRWHAHLLNEYLPRTAKTPEQSWALNGQSLMALHPRPWWSEAVPDDGYIYAHLTRHLASANLYEELHDLLLDVRWTHLRVQIGGVLALKCDFGYLDSLSRGIECSSSEQTHSAVVEHTFDHSPGFECLLKALQLSWGMASKGNKALLFQICGRLLRLKTGNEIVRTYLRSVENNTKKPYLVPVSSTFPDLCNAQQMEIPVAGDCFTVSCSPCNQYFAAGAGHGIVVGDAVTGDTLKVLKGHNGDVKCITFCAGSRQIVSGSEDKTVALWNWESPGSSSLKYVLKGHRDRINDIAVSADATRILSCSCDKTLRVWDALTGLETRVFLQHSCIYSIALCFRDCYVALGLGDGTLKVLDRLTWETAFEASNAHDEIVTSIAYSPSAKCLATGSFDDTIRLWNIETWKAIGQPLRGHSGFVNRVVISPDGKQITSGSNDGTVRLWDAASGRTTWTSPQLHSSVESVTFAFGGKRIISGSQDGTVRMWDALPGSELEDHEYRHTKAVNDVAISQDGMRVVSGSRDKTLRLWDSKTGYPVGCPLEGHERSVVCVSFSHDGRFVVSGSDDSTVRIWDSDTYSQIGHPLAGHSEAVRSVFYSYDGLRVISGSDDKTVRIWNAQTREQTGDALEGHTEPISFVSETFDGHHIVSKDWEGETIIWSRTRSQIVWVSNTEDRDHENTLSKEAAKHIIGSCGLQAAHQLPTTIPQHTTEVFCVKRSVYYQDEENLIGFFPASVRSWEYNASSKIFAAGLQSGAVSISRFVCE